MVVNVDSIEVQQEGAHAQGREDNVTFYGKSFILDHMGMLVELFGGRDDVDGAQMNMGYLIHTFEGVP